MGSRIDELHGGEFWTTRSQPADERPGRWEQMLSATHLPWTVEVPGADPDRVFEASVRRWWIDDLALVDCECDPCSGSRGRPQLSGTDGEFVVVLITRAGSETVSQGGTETILQAGDAVAWDSTRPARFAVWEPLSKRSLLIPRGALDEVSGRTWFSDGITLNGAAPATRLLTTYLDTLREALPALAPPALSAARNATLELFIGAVRADADVPTTAMARPALRAAMDRYIERHLLDALTPAAIASAHAVSIRTVNRIFNSTGQTVGEVVRARRLARAREELTETDHTVAGIAHRWGFADTSHFSRRFKAHYGSSPTDYRAHARGAGAGVQRPVATVQGTAAPGSETGAGATRG